MACCCKGRPRIHGSVTLWKIDVATGQLIWAADRGVGSQALDVTDESGSVMVYEGGPHASGFLALTKWMDNGDGADKLWRFSKSTNNIGELQVSDFDDSIWLSHNVTTSTRVDAAGAEINSGTVAAANRLLARVANGNMNYWASAPAAVNQYDTSFTSVASISIAAGTIFPLSENHKWTGDNGWIADLSATQLRHYASDLSTVETFTHGVGSAITPLGVNAQRFCTEHGTVNLRVYSLSPITLRYTVSFVGTAGSTVFDSLNNLYFLSTQGGATHITSYDDSGNLRWDRTAITLGTGALNAQGELVFLRSTSAAMDLDNASDNFALARLDPGTGDTMWGASYCRSATSDCIKTHGAYVYVCGARVAT